MRRLEVRRKNVQIRFASPTNSMREWLDGVFWSLELLLYHLFQGFVPRTIRYLAMRAFMLAAMIVLVPFLTLTSAAPIPYPSTPRQ